jgi:hypothetical protein
MNNFYLHRFSEMLSQFMSSIGILNADFNLLGPKAMYTVPSSTDFCPDP